MFIILLYLFLDIDECSLGTDDCDQECVNTEGNYTCQCFPNYRLINATDCEGTNTVVNFECLKKSFVLMYQILTSAQC